MKAGITQVVTFGCQRGDGEATVEFDINLGQGLVVPILPPGWTQFGKLIYCPNHTIEVKDKPEVKPNFTPPPGGPPNPPPPPPGRKHG